MVSRAKFFHVFALLLHRCTLPNPQHLFVLTKITFSTERFLYNISGHQAKLSSLRFLLVHACCDDSHVFWARLKWQDWSFLAGLIVCVFGPLPNHSQDVDLSSGERLCVVRSDDFAES